MKFNTSKTLQEIANLLKCDFIGDPNQPVLGFNEIHRVEQGDVVFVDHPKYYSKALDSAATVILIDQEVSCPEGKGLLISDDPFRDFNRLTDAFRPFTPLDSSKGQDVSIGEGTHIQPGVTIGNQVRIGKHCLIHSGVRIYDHTIIGDHVEIHANSILGADAFYFQRKPHGFEKLKSSGHVEIEDHVEIGAACTIDKGVSAVTRIGKGSKLDNQVHIAHDVVVGENCLFAAQAAVAGCVTIGNDVTLWGQTAVASGITLADNTTLYAQSGINRSTDPGTTYFGSPAQEAKTAFRQFAALKKIPDLLNKLEE